MKNSDHSRQYKLSKKPNISKTFGRAFNLNFSDQYQRSKLWLGMLAVVCLIMVMFTPDPAAGAVELVFFKGAFLEAPTSVQLEWKTAYESRTAGYFIKRKVTGSDDPAVVISVKMAHDASSSETNFVPAAEDGITGADYAVYDFSIVQGENYEYSLWEQEFNNSEPSEPEKILEIEANPQKVSTELGSSGSENTVASPSPTASPTDSSSDGSTSTPVATSTPAPTFPPTSTPNGATAATTTTVTPRSTASGAQNGSDDDPPTPAFTPPVPQDTAPGSETEESAPIQITVVPTSPSSSESGVAEAAELPQDDTYPEPSPEAGNQQNEEYVPPAPTSTPPPINDQDILPIAEGVEQATAPTELGGQAVEQVSQEEISRNRLILWGGFLGSLLFFIAVVIGTILMYRQRNNRG